MHSHFARDMSGNLMPIFQLNTILVKELLEIASEVVVHRITQVGRIRAGYYTVILIV